MCYNCNTKDYSPQTCPRFLLFFQIYTSEEFIATIMQPLTLTFDCGIKLFIPYYVYIFKYSDEKYYYGYTGDLNSRLVLNRQGKVRSTKPLLAVELVYYETYPTVVEARKRERGFKNGRTRSKTINWLIDTFPKDKLIPFA